MKEIHNNREYKRYVLKEWADPYPCDGCRKSSKCNGNSCVWKVERSWKNYRKTQWRELNKIQQEKDLQFILLKGGEDANVT